MRRLALSLVGFMLAVSSAVAQEAEGKKADAFLRRMTDKKVPWPDRCDAEDELAKLPSEIVLPKLLPLASQSMPEGGIYNSAGREHDKQAPIAWQIWYALGRSWDAQVARLPRDDTGGDFLVALLSKASKDREKSLLVRDLQTRWSPKAEEPMAKLLLNANAPTELRNAAAWALVRHGKRSYQDDLIKVYDTVPQDYRYRWLELLTWRGNKEKTGLDPRVLQLGFRLLCDEDEIYKKTLKNYPDAVHGGYFPACYLSDYVGQKFQPDPHDPRYDDSHGRRDRRWFADTVYNALAWWEKNRSKFK
jgi:hypothetical protein